MSWPTVKLSEVTTVNPRLPKDADDTQKVSFIAMASTSEEGLLLNEESRILAETRKGFTYFEKSDVLLAKITPCFENGKCLRPNQITNQIGFGSTEFHVLRASPEKIDSAYLFYMIWNKRFRYLGEASMSGAAGQKRVSADFLKEFEIPLPPLTEQKRIAAILDKADAIRRKRQQAIQLADDFLRAVFLDMFGDPVTNPKGWEVKPLSKGIDLITSGWSAKGESYPCQNGKTGVLKISSVTSGKFKPEENKLVYEERIPKGKVLVFPGKGDLLFSRANTRELVAATCIVPSDVNNVFLPDKLWKITTKTTALLPEFLNHLIWQPRFKEKLTSQATGTSGSMLNISKSKFESTETIFPPLHLQKEFNSIYWKVQTTICCLEESLLKVEETLNSISQNAFKGLL
ncbi:restriction endonuclease subunit S [Desulfogranum marinum]|uniref:restriction endonuclease subunit S n=1 Tax=Desulfogranum marinum TaxID=453220 RepID=UPI0029C783FB|nr:restriction endonuclease subunit S [Desulfogranum marinum]